MNRAHAAPATPPINEKPLPEFRNWPGLRLSRAKGPRLPHMAYLHLQCSVVVNGHERRVLEMMRHLSGVIVHAGFDDVLTISDRSRYLHCQKEQPVPSRRTRSWFARQSCTIWPILKGMGQHNLWCAKEIGRRVLAVKYSEGRQSNPLDDHILSVHPE